VEAAPIQAVGFTGSVAAGQFLWRSCQRPANAHSLFRRTRLANPLVVTSAAAADQAASIGAGIAASMTLGVGQFCTKPGLLFIPSNADGDQLVTTLVGELRTLSP